MAALVLGPRTEPGFHPDSYGYRPGRSALGAVAAARQRSWKYSWAIDLDIRGYFDSIPWDKLMAAVNTYLDPETRWIGLYVERWIAAPLVRADGVTVERTSGCAQGGPLSPLLANIFGHYVFDRWMARKYPAVPFERYSDDVVVHCVRERQARVVLADIRRRLGECGLELNEAKTRIVYCADDGRKQPWDGPTGYDFLGYTFRGRTVQRRRDGRLFVSFTPAISDQNAKKARRAIRRWRIHGQTTRTLEDLAAMINPVTRGWINYFGAFRRSALYPVFHSIDKYLVRWLQRKYKRLTGRPGRAWRTLAAIKRRRPALFAHWTIGAAIG